VSRTDPIAVLIKANYNTETVPWTLEGYTLSCTLCLESWAGLPSKKGKTLEFTGSGLDRQAEKHLKTCPRRTT
jgi:hypothetical protein